MKTAYIIDATNYPSDSVLYKELRKYDRDYNMGQNTFSEWYRGEEDDEDYPEIAKEIELMCPDINLPVYIHCWW